MNDAPIVLNQLEKSYSTGDVVMVFNTIIVNQYLASLKIVLVVDVIAEDCHHSQ